MAESSLSLGFPDFQAAVGFYLGWGRTVANYSANQLARIADIIKSGLRQFYHPVPVDNRPAWKWTFLSPPLSVVTVSGTDDYDLPDDFGGIDGQFLTFEAGQIYQPVEIVAEYQIRVLRGVEVSGIPRYAAVRPKTSDGTDGQRWEILFWPNPNDAYTFTGTYQALQEAIDDSAPYPLGGEPHVETVLASCLAVAEYETTEQRGVRWQQFMDRLRTSIDYDAALFVPPSLGYGHDPSNHLGAVERHQNTGDPSFVENGTPVV